MSRKTIKIRDVVAKSDDPIQLITTDLKTACGLKSSMEINTKMMKDLKDSLKELQSCFSHLKDKLKGSVFKEFNLINDGHQSLVKLKERAQLIKNSNVGAVAKFNLLVNILSSADDNWVSKFASALVTKNLEKWSDSDEKNFYIELHDFAREFKKNENLAKTKSDFSKKDRKMIQKLKEDISNLLDNKESKIQEQALIDLLDKVRN